MFNQNSPKFTITGGGADFSSRQKSLFDTLDAVEGASRSTNRSSDVSMEITTTEEEMAIDLFDSSRRHKRQRRTETKQFRGKESIFKRPEAPPPWRTGSMPDHKKNPHKWTKYSLGDVSQADMSDKTNTSTALSFLNELRKRKLSVPDILDMGEEPVEKLASQVLFKKPSNYVRYAQNEETTVTSTSAFRGSKRVMPEYIVGQNPKKDKKKQDQAKNKNKSGAKSELQLNHLLEYEDD
jgi:hypothetical protein